MRVCIKCLEEKEITNFPKSKFKTKICLSCSQQIKREYAKEYNQTDKGKRVVLSKALKHRYGITLEEYEVLLESQNFKCKICGSKENTQGWRLAVDHCHKTGRVRGLLCHNCNRALGLFKDNAENLKKAIWYVEERATTISSESTPKQVEAQGKGKRRYALRDIV